MSYPESAIDDILSELEKVRFGGWLSPINQFEKERSSLSKGLMALHFKMRQGPDFPMMAALQGGTGTGKSTFFNALIGAPVSRTGVERPQTRGSIFFVPGRWISRFMDARPFKTFPHEKIVLDRTSSLLDGVPGSILLLEHEMPYWDELILIDSPDLDSVEEANRELAEDILLLCDLVIFITSQEKYADQLPFQFIQDAQIEGKPYLIIINKLESPEGLDDFSRKLEEFGLKPLKKVFGFPRVAKDTTLIFDQEQVEVLKKTLGELNRTEITALSLNALARHCELLVDKISGSLVKEAGLHHRLLQRIQSLTLDAQKKVDRRLSKGLDEQSQREIKAHIRKLLARYDFLQRPRNWVRDVFRLPLRIIGFEKKRREEPGVVTLRFTPEDLRLEPLYEAHAYFQRSVLNLMSEDETLPGLYGRIIQENVFFPKDELRTRYNKEQEKIDRWIQEKFRELRKGLSLPKELGLYSASVLSGIFLVAVETVIGGGLTFFELMLDTAIAPFIPKGVLEIFVYDKLKEIGRELDKRHREALYRILEEQRNALGEFLESSMTGSRDMAFFAEIKRWMQESAGSFNGKS